MEYLRVISGFRRVAGTICALLGHYAAVFLDFLTLEYGTDRISETSVWNYHSTLRNIP